MYARFGVSETGSEMLLSDCGRWASALVSGHEQTFLLFCLICLNTPAFAASVFNVDRVFVDTKRLQQSRPEKLPCATDKEGAGDCAQTPDAELAGRNCR